MQFLDYTETANWSESGQLQFWSEPSEIFFLNHFRDDYLDDYFDDFLDDFSGDLFDDYFDDFFDDFS